MKHINSLLVLLTAMVGLSSCLKDESLIHPDNAENIIEFYNNTPITSNTSSIYPVYTPLTLDPVATAEYEAVISYSGADVAPQDITVQLEASAAAVATYNTTHGTTYTALPAGTFTLPASVTIPKGQRQVKFAVGLKPDQFDASKSNVLAVTIKSASMGTISGNFGTVIFNLPVKSIWDGVYTVTVQNNYGALDANIGVDPYVAEDVVLSTVGPNRLRTQYVAQTYGGYTEYQFNGDNTSITSVVGFSGSARATSIEEIVEIVPGEVFEIRWTFFGRGLRERYVKQ